MCNYKRPIVLIALLFGLTYSSGCSQSGFDAVLAVRLQATLDQAVSELHLPGAALAVRSPDGEVWSGTSGRAEVAGAILVDGSPASTVDLPISLDQHFHIGSLTKSFTATVILMLVDEGKLMLDQTVAEVIAQWLPNYFDFTIPYADTITLRHLLSMRSGMGNYSYDSKFQEAANATPLRHWDPKELIRFGVESTDFPPYAPDTRFDYNNGNYILLGIFIEQITGHNYTEVINERLLAPLELSQTSVPADMTMPTPYAHGYKYDDTQGGLIDLSCATDPSWGWSAGSMVSTVGDLLNWVRALVDGTLISPEMQHERLQLQTGEIHGMDTIDYGLGIYSDRGALGHGGDYSGFYTAYGTRYANYDIAIMENGRLEQTSESVGIPAREILLRVIATLELSE